MRAILFTVAIMALLLFAVGCNSDNGVPDISNIVGNDVITTVQDKDLGDDTFDLSYSYTSLGSGHYRFVVETTYTVCSVNDPLGMHLPMYYDEDVVEVTDYENGSIIACQTGSTGWFIGLTSCDGMIGGDYVIWGREYWPWTCDDSPDNVLYIITFETIDPILNPASVEFEWGYSCDYLGDPSDPVIVRDVNNQDLPYNLTVNSNVWEY